MLFKFSRIQTDSAYVARENILEENNNAKTLLPPPSFHLVRETEPDKNLKKMNLQSNCLVIKALTQLGNHKQLWQDLILLMFYRDIDRKVVTLQDFQQEKMEKGLLTNSYIPTLPKHVDCPIECTKKVFLFKVRHAKVFSGSESVFVTNWCSLL